MGILQYKVQVGPGAWLGGTDEQGRGPDAVSTRVRGLFIPCPVFAQPNGAGFYCSAPGMARHVAMREAASITAKKQAAADPRGER
jgi:hypothetical protein